MNLETLMNTNSVNIDQAGCFCDCIPRKILERKSFSTACRNAWLLQRLDGSFSYCKDMSGLLDANMAFLNLLKNNLWTGNMLNRSVMTFTHVVVAKTFVFSLFSVHIFKQS